MTDDIPALYPTVYRRPAPNTWRLVAIEQLPPDWVNVRLLVLRPNPARQLVCHR